MTFLILFFGFLFGAILQYAQLNRYNTISGMAMLTDLRFAKAIVVMVGEGAFEGGGYVAKGVFLPMQDCLIMSFKVDKFCPVCQKAI